MRVSKEGWLIQVLGEALASHSADPSKLLSDPAYASKTPRARARAYLRQVLRQSGLAFGTPAQTATEPEGRSAEDALFRAVILAFAKMALDIAVLLNAPAGRRAEQLLVLFSTLGGDPDDVEALLHQVQRGPSQVPKKLWARAEALLDQRALSLAGDRMYGLVLHNGAVYADALAFGRQAIELFLTGELQAESARRRLLLAGRQKALLVEVLTALVSAERRPSFATRKAILRQVEDLRLPSDLASALRTRVKKSFDRVPSLATVVRNVRSRDMRRFILEQTLLCSLVDGRRSERELEVIGELAAALSIPAEELGRIEMEMAEFYAKNRAIVDVFTVQEGAQLMGEELVETMQDQLEKNFRRLMREVRETGELSLLLAKAARGVTLTPEERRAMRAQLIDVAKAIPALAIFAAPGGVLLLVALAKVLPFNILPSAFQEDPDADEQPRRQRS